VALLGHTPQPKTGRHPKTAPCGRLSTTPAELYGQVTTTAAGLKVGLFAMGAGLAGPVATGFGSAEAILAAAGMQFVAASAGLVLMRVPGRKRAPTAS
jgi:hypothetical protein